MGPLAELRTAADHPLYNIGVVTRMTKISIATLRAWERRYGFPASSRTQGGHRLYSDQDIIRLRWVKAQIEQGMQTAQAINALLYQETSGKVDEARPVALPQSAQSGATVMSLREQLFAALLHHDTDRADLMLGEALPLLHTEGLILDVIGPVMADIGDAWHRKETDIGTEHLATNYLRQRLLMWMISGPQPYAMRPIILACAPNELHEGGLLMLGALLRRRRWPVAYLGQMTPLQDLTALVRDIDPPLVVLVAATDAAASALVEWPVWLPDAAQSGKPVVAFGGRVFSEHAEWRLRVPGVFLGATLRDGLDTIERLLH
jgi:MerR family transcriptional regulator, light-induced transcriptional regulator